MISDKTVVSGKQREFLQTLIVAQLAQRFLNWDLQTPWGSADRFQGVRELEWTLEDGTDRLSRNVG